jgi:hypothetical protein
VWDLISFVLDLLFLAPGGRASGKKARGGERAAAKGWRWLHWPVYAAITLGVLMLVVALAALLLAG